MMEALDNLHKQAASKVSGLNNQKAEVDKLTKEYKYKLASLDDFDQLK